MEYAFVSRGKSQEIFKISHCFSERKNSVHTISSKNSKIPSNPLANFNSLNCLGHYENKMFLLQYLARRESRSSLRIPLVSESFFTRGKNHAMEPNHPANEIVVNDDFKFVYVEIRKIGSSTIRQMLRTYFNSSFNHCPDSIPKSDACLVIGRRCSTLCLTEEHVQNYFFFSFVRNPEDGFFSGYKEAFNQRFSKRGVKLGSQTHIKEVLETIISSHYHSDQHLESQTMSITSPLIDGNGQMHRIPIDFIGRVEFLEDDLKDLLNILQSRTTRKAPDIKAGRSNPGGAALHYSAGANQSHRNRGHSAENSHSLFARFCVLRLPLNSLCGTLNELLIR